MSDLKINNITDRTGGSGPVFAGICTVTSTGAFTVPSGPTEMRGGRGRGIWAGGSTPSQLSTIEYIEIATTGNSSDFGDLRFANSGPNGNLSSSTRGYYVGTYEQPANALATSMQYVVLSSAGHATYFGDLQYARSAMGTASNGTRGLIYGGDNPEYLSVIDHITLSSTGTESSFGDVLDNTPVRNSSGVQSPTRAVWCGGSDPSSATNKISYSTFATKGDALNFGELTTARADGCQASSTTRGIHGGGKTPSITNIIEYITIATFGNGTDFGDLTSGRRNSASCNSTVRGVFSAGCTTASGSSGNVNTIDYITIASTGNATDFGDTVAVKRLWNSGNSDCHGGIGD